MSRDDQNDRVSRNVGERSFCSALPALPRVNTAEADERAVPAQGGQEIAVLKYTGATRKRVTHTQRQSCVIRRKKRIFVR